MLARISINRKIITSAIIWFILNLLAAGVRGLTGSIDLLVLPLKIFLIWEPHFYSSELIKFIYLNFLLLIYTGTLRLGWLLLKWTLHTLVVKDESILTTPYFLSVTQESLYTKEIGAVVDLIEREKDKEEIRSQVDNLLRIIGNNIAASFGLKANDFRFVYIIPDQNGWASIRIGNQQNLNEWDEKIVNLLLNTQNSSIVWTKPKSHFPKSDAEAVAMVRNSEKFRLGFAMIIKKRGTISQKHLNHFYISSSIITLIGYIEKIMEVLLEYCKQRKEVKSKQYNQQIKIFFDYEQTKKPNNDVIWFKREVKIPPAYANGLKVYRGNIPK